MVKKGFHAQRYIVPYGGGEIVEDPRWKIPYKRNINRGYKCYECGHTKFTWSEKEKLWFCDECGTPVRGIGVDVRKGRREKRPRSKKRTIKVEFVLPTGYTKFPDLSKKGNSFKLTQTAKNLFELEKMHSTEGIASGEWYAMNGEELKSLSDRPTGRRIEKKLQVGAGVGNKYLENTLRMDKAGKNPIYPEMRWKDPINVEQRRKAGKKKTEAKKEATKSKPRDKKGRFKKETISDRVISQPRNEKGRFIQKKAK
jgi:ribosomal protein L37AE/L43A